MKKAMYCYCIIFFVYLLKGVALEKHSIAPIQFLSPLHNKTRTTGYNNHNHFDDNSDLSPFKKKRSVPEIKNITSIQKDHRRYTTAVLPNGFSIIYIEDPLILLPTLTLSSRVGAQYDTLPGLAHLTEHCLLLKSKDYPNSTLQQFANSNGGTSNACTSLTQMNFIITTLEIALVEAADRLRAFIECPLLPSNSIEREISAIASEYALRKPRFSTMVLLRDVMVIKGHPIGKIHFGYQDLETTFKNKGAEYLKMRMAAFAFSHFVTSKLRLLVVGPHPASIFLENITKIFEKMPRDFPKDVKDIVKRSKTCGIKLNETDFVKALEAEKQAELLLAHPKQQRRLVMGDHGVIVYHQEPHRFPLGHVRFSFYFPMEYTAKPSWYTPWFLSMFLLQTIDLPNSNLPDHLTLGKLKEFPLDPHNNDAAGAVGFGLHCVKDCFEPKLLLQIGNVVFPSIIHFLKSVSVSTIADFINVNHQNVPPELDDLKMDFSTHDDPTQILYRHTTKVNDSMIEEAFAYLKEVFHPKNLIVIAETSSLPELLLQNTPGKEIHIIKSVDMTYFKAPIDPEHIKKWLQSMSHFEIPIAQQHNEAMSQLLTTAKSSMNTSKEILDKDLQSIYNTFNSYSEELEPLFSNRDGYIQQLLDKARLLNLKIPEILIESQPQRLTLSQNDSHHKKHLNIYWENVSPNKLQTNLIYWRLKLKSDYIISDEKETQCLLGIIVSVVGGIVSGLSRKLNLPNFGVYMKSYNDGLAIILFGKFTVSEHDYIAALKNIASALSDIKHKRIDKAFLETKTSEIISDQIYGTLLGFNEKSLGRKLIDHIYDPKKEEYLPYLEKFANTSDIWTTKLYPILDSLLTSTVGDEIDLCVLGHMSKNVAITTGKIIGDIMNESLTNISSSIINGTKRSNILSIPQVADSWKILPSKTNLTLRAHALNHVSIQKSETLVISKQITADDGTSTLPISKGCEFFVTLEHLVKILKREAIRYFRYKYGMVYYISTNLKFLTSNVARVNFIIESSTHSLDDLLNTYYLFENHMISFLNTYEESKLQKDLKVDARLLIEYRSLARYYNLRTKITKKKNYKLDDPHIIDKYLWCGIAAEEYAMNSSKFHKQLIHMYEMLLSRSFTFFGHIQQATTLPLREAINEFYNGTICQIESPRGTIIKKLPCTDITVATFN